MEQAPASKNYGFVINNKTCIGCHACSVACKSENDVPLGVYRTWVKYTEEGTYPESKRHFQVTRCNHCEKPPCVEICPVTAMYKREDGIVEFDQSACIGCKACMQACPYDAIYLDPNNGTTAKCHYCSHRTEIGLEPACVVVCPTNSIIAGDLNDPSAPISQLVTEYETQVRKPECGTQPNLFYVEGHEASLNPLADQDAPSAFMWSDVVSEQGSAGPIQIGQGRMAEQMVQVGYNAQHKVPWHWPVAAYMVTKGISAGLFLLMTLAWALDYQAVQHCSLVASSVILFFMLVTTVLLVVDLERPERFLRILTRPQWKSWLTKGAVVLIAFSGLVTAWLGLEIALAMAWLPASKATPWRGVLLVLGSPLALLTAIYTAFLFAQAKGRDLWGSRLFGVHLAVQALLAGAAGFFFLAFLFPQNQETQSGYRFFLQVGTVALVGHMLIIAYETLSKHESAAVARAIHEMTKGKYAKINRWGVQILGQVLPVAIFAILAITKIGARIEGLGIFMLSLIGLFLLLGLYFYKYIFVMAPQKIPNS